MMAYRATKAEFLVDAPTIEDKIRAGVQHKLGINIRTDSSEYNSWKNSIGNAMFHVINNPKLPHDTGVAIEYRLSGQKMRIDFLLSGLDANKRSNVVVVELKQWSELELGLLKDFVRTPLGGALVESQHPAYQARSYQIALKNFNSAVEKKNIKLTSCAYLHNCMDDSVIRGPTYTHLTDKTPVFIKGEGSELSDYLASRIKLGDQASLLHEIEHAPIAVSKSLSANISSLLEDNEEFALIDDQKLVLEEIMHAYENLEPGKKKVFLIEGGPGSGKSLIAINALVELVKHRANARYVTNNAAPRNVYAKMLAGHKDAAEIEGLFTGANEFREMHTNELDVILVDEAHRLTANWGFYRTKGPSQIDRVIDSAKLSVFFVDDLQQVTWNDLGSVAEIRRWAGKYKVSFSERYIDMQFRCAGSDSYVTWATNIVKSSPERLTIKDFDSFEFAVFDDPVEMAKAIKEKNRIANKARLLAGYCWNWKSKKDPKAMDIEIPDTDFAMQWNLSTDPTWMISPDSVNQVGCIHTAQGLETDYVGVIIGPDLIYRDGKLITDPSARATSDQSMRGWKAAMKTDPEKTVARTDQLIRNTYRALLTRGMKGCYVYSTDSQTQEYIKSQLPEGVSTSSA